MSKPLRASINVSLIDRERLFEGKKGKYLNLVMIETPDSEYGTHIIKQDCTQEEREGGLEMPILGNIKRPKEKTPAPQQTEQAASTEESDDIPF